MALESGMRLGPYQIINVLGVGGLSLYVARHYESAIRFGERALELQPDFVLGVWPVVFASCLLNRPARAIGLLERLIDLTNRSPLLDQFASLPGIPELFQRLRLVPRL